MKKEHFITVLGILALCACMGLAVQQRWRFPLVNTAVNSILLPFNRGVLWIYDGVAGFAADRRTNAALQKENAALKKEIESLRGVEFRLARTEAENERLTAMAGYKAAHPEQTLLPARVLGISLGDLHEYFFLDKGAADGIRTDMMVTTGLGVAGAVDQVYPHYSRFLLISGNRSRIGVKVLRPQSRAVGVLTGNGPNRGFLQAEYFGRDDDLKPGDLLVTSGIGGKYPAGLLVGTVRSVQNDVTGLQKRAQVEPAAELDCLDRVFVILYEDESLRVKKEMHEAGAGGTLP